MLGTSYATGIIGGPFQWLSPQAPAAFADPPAWFTHLAWVVIAGVVAHAFLTRRRTGRAWALLLGYLVVLLLLLWSSRAPFVGAVAGTEYRYMTDAAAHDGARPRAGLPRRSPVRRGRASRGRTPFFTPRVPVAVPIALALAVAVGGIFSSITVRPDLARLHASARLRRCA